MKLFTLLKPALAWAITQWRQDTQKISWVHPFFTLIVFCISLSSNYRDRTYQGKVDQLEPKLEQVAAQVKEAKDSLVAVEHRMEVRSKENRRLIEIHSKIDSQQTVMFERMAESLEAIRASRAAEINGIHRMTDDQMVDHMSKIPLPKKKKEAGK